jgi:hypothetical protein
LVRGVGWEVRGLWRGWRLVDFGDGTNVVEAVGDLLYGYEGEDA